MSRGRQAPESFVVWGLGPQGLGFRGSSELVV